MTRLPQSEEKREEWSQKLRIDIKEKLGGLKTGFLCRKHFPLQKNTHFRPRQSLPLRPRKLSEKIDIDEPVENLDSESPTESLSDDLICSSDKEYDPTQEGFADKEEDFEEQERYEYLLVDYEILLKALLFCRKCYSEDVSFKLERNNGACTSMLFDCNNCRATWHWASSKLLGKSKQRAVNSIISSSCAVVGLPYSVCDHNVKLVKLSVLQKLLEFFNCARIPCLKKRRNYQILKKYVMPAVADASEEVQKEELNIVLLDSQKTGSLNLAGDAMFDTPGYNAEYCKYSLLDVKTNMVVDVEVTKKPKKESSKAQEPKSLERVLNRVIDAIESHDKKIKIDSITTDRDPSVSNLLKTKFKSIKQHYDAWHYVRNLQKALWKKEDQTQMRPVKPWIRLLTNHLYHAIGTSKGNGKLAVQKFMGFFLHVQNKHKGFKKFRNFKFTKIRKCEHKKLVNNSNYLDITNDKDSKALDILVEMSTKGKKLDDLERVSPFFSHNNEKGFAMRSQLSTLHWNSLKLEERSGSRQKSGTKSHFSKSLKRIVWNDFFTPATHSWRRKIVEDVKKRCSIIDNNGTKIPGVKKEGKLGGASDSDEEMLPDSTTG
ncbi:hypothetical protein CAEBREN_07462 [Caenorhabditis brenneri]|uniref:THAP-type domain-containing protein n=1 Tax=Caenorhabditis brenneri TaxID=135651 RepID=G0PJY7_CAEBE|nr:hypothetical protein CAEBREN_07462 [Caenorhabditis brenneri]